MKIICFPYAGSHTRVFTPLRNYLKENRISADVIEVDYAGHGRRFSETLIHSIQNNAVDIFKRLLPELNKVEPVVLVGYSMGSLIAYEIAKLMLEQGIEVSRLLFMAATPPHKIEVSTESYEDEDNFLKKCQTYGLIKEDQFKSKELRKLFLPALFNDITSVEHYNLMNNYQRVTFDKKVAVSVFQGEMDETVSSIEKWQELSDGQIAFYTYPAGHFFYYDCQEKLFADIYTALTDQSKLLNIKADRGRKTDGKFIITAEAEIAGKS
ncbi:thioesterase [Listeria monocytogenes]|uniref:thioesterase II family protein n=1 Tax=Listeria monocytogenes TaxID=1639 RepID=UPI0010E53EA2|nr:alpha/beta fold hydrolase [Listeria monocytogenes]EAD7632590.1 thioesterase [Listeria monocytogenes]